MRFKKGDKVWMITTGSADARIPSSKGIVSEVVASKMRVVLENGDTIIQNVENDLDLMVRFVHDMTPPPDPRDFFSPKNLFFNIFK